MHPNGTAAVARHQAGPVSPVITREASATLTLSRRACRGGGRVGQADGQGGTPSRPAGPAAHRPGHARAPSRRTRGGL